MTKLFGMVVLNVWNVPNIVYRAIFIAPKIRGIFA